MVYYQKDYMKVYSKNGYIYIEDECTHTNVALNDGDFDGVIMALQKAKDDTNRRVREVQESMHVQNGKVIF